MKPLANPTHRLVSAGRTYAAVRFKTSTGNYSAQLVDPFTGEPKGEVVKAWGPSACDDLMMAAYYTAAYHESGNRSMHGGIWRWAGVMRFLFGADREHIPDAAVLEPWE